MDGSDCLGEAGKHMAKCVPIVLKIPEFWAWAEIHRA